MATLATLTQDVYNMLYGMAQVERPAEDTLSTLVTDDADVEWRFATPTLWNRGDIAEDQAAGELVYITEDHPSAADVTVRRGQRGTTAKVAGYAAGDVFYKNPVYTRQDIERFINETIDNDLWPNVWMWGEHSFSFSSGDTTYEMPANCGDVAQVYQYDLGSSSRLYPIDTRLWEYQGLLNSAVSTNQNFLRLRRVHDETATVYVTYKQKPLSSAIDDLSDEVAAMIPYRVVGKLLAGVRIAPSRTAPGRSSPVVNTSDSQLYRDFAAYDVLFRQMRKQEWNRLTKQVPVQRRFRSRRVWSG